MLKLSAQVRQNVGRGLNQLRQEGFIPAILYGEKMESLPLIVKTKDFEKIYQQAGQSALIELKTQNPYPAKQNFGGEGRKLKDDGQEAVVLIQDIQRDPITDKIIHIDFYRVRMDKVLRAEVPLVFIGESPAVEIEKGVLIKNIQKVEVEALPKDLPKEIKVDISSLKTFDDNIYIKDISLAGQAKIIAGPEEVVASVIPPRGETELEELEKAPEEKVEEVRVEAEEKKEIKAEEKAEEEKTEEESREKK